MPTLTIGLYDGDANSWYAEGGELLPRTSLMVGHFGSGNTGYVISLRFADFGEIPAGSVIDSAQLHLSARYRWGSSPTVRIGAVDVAQAGVVYDKASGEAARANLTSAFALWTPPDWVPSTYYATSDIAPVIQEVIDRPDWADWGALNLILEPDVDYQGFEERLQVEEATDNQPPYLTVSFTAPSASPTGASTSSLAFAGSASGDASRAGVATGGYAAAGAASGLMTGSLPDDAWSSSMAWASSDAWAGHASPPAGGQISTQVVSGADDGYRHLVFGSQNFNATGTTVSVGTGGSSTSAAAFFRLVLDVPQGATVTAASLALVATGWSGWGTFSGRVDAYAADDAVAPTSFAQHSGASRTSASVPWSESTSSWATGSTRTSPDLAAVVQEVVNRPNWSAGNHILLSWEPVGAQTLLLNARSFEGNAGQAATLDVEYTTAASAPPSEGLVDGGYAVAGAATGVAEHDGSAGGGFTLAGAATGVVARGGSVGGGGQEELTVPVVASADAGFISQPTDTVSTAYGPYIHGGGWYEPVTALFRFADLPIAQSASITEARLELIFEGSDPPGITCAIHADASDDSAPFVDGQVDVRPLTAASASWAVPITTWGVDTGVTTPDFAAVVQEVVDRPGWTAGNALTVLIAYVSGEGYADVLGFERGPVAGAPALVVSYETAGVAAAFDLAGAAQGARSPEAASSGSWQAVGTAQGDAPPNSGSAGGSGGGVARVNLIPNPSFEVDTTGWTAGGSSSKITRRTTGPMVGVGVGYVEDIGFGDGVNVYTSSPGMPIVGGLPYAAVLHARASHEYLLPITVRIYWRQNSSTISTTTATYSILPEDGYVPLVVGGVAPASATHIMVGLSVPHSGGQFYLTGIHLDAVLLEQAEQPGEYFDGDTEGASWSGTPHASSSSIAGVGQPLGWDFTGSAAGAAQRKGLATRDFAFTLIVATGDVPPNVGLTTSSTVAFTGSAVGVRIVEGAAEAVVDHAGSATGDVPANDGDTTGTFALTGSATAATLRSAYTVGHFLTVGEAAGQTPLNPPGEGAASATIAFEGAAAGAAPGAATAVGTVEYASALTGTRTPVALTTGTHHYAGTGAGDVPPNAGAAGGQYAVVTASAVGVRAPKAEAGREYAFALVVATGDVPPNIGHATAGEYRVAAGGAGSVNRAGSTAGDYELAATATSAMPRDGHAAGGMDTAGTARGKTPTRGASSGTSSTAGSAVGATRRLGGTTRAVRHDGTATGRKRCTGSTSTTGSWSGTSVGVRRNRGAATGSYWHTHDAHGTRTVRDVTVTCSLRVHWSAEAHLTPRYAEAVPRTHWAADARVTPRSADVHTAWTARSHT